MSGDSINRLLFRLSRVTKAEYPVSRMLLRSVVYSVETKEKVIALTFDDGPQKDTHKLLEVLEANGAKGTFFDVGNKLEEYRSLIKEMHGHGHELANHTWNHARFNTVSLSEMLDQLRRTSRVLQDITGCKPRFMRPPGKISTDFRNVLTYVCCGLKSVYDTVSPPDFRPDCPVSLIRDALLDLAAPGDIYCLHDIHPHTRQALAEALPVLRERGYRFLTLSQMAAVGKLSPCRNKFVPLKYREYTLP